MPAKLYGMAISHPSHAARKMLERKGIEHQVVNLMPGMHPPMLRLAGFGGGTVPALLIDGRRIQGSVAIARTLEELQPDPPLYPRDPDARRRVEEAERWGDRELQPVPRRLFRWGVANNPALRRRLTGQVVPAPLAGPLSKIAGAQARAFARKSHAGEQGVRLSIERLPGRLDHVDELIAAGTIGGEEPNAADFQILSTVKVLLSFADVRPAIEDRPAAALARRLFPHLGAHAPPFLPSEWLSPLRR